MCVWPVHVYITFQPLQQIFWETLLGLSLPTVNTHAYCWLQITTHSHSNLYSYSRHTSILYVTLECSGYLPLRCHFKATCNALNEVIFPVKQQEFKCLKDTGISELSGVNSEINLQPLCYLLGFLIIRPSPSVYVPVTTCWIIPYKSNFQGCPHRICICRTLKKAQQISAELEHATFTKFYKSAIPCVFIF